MKINLSNFIPSRRDGRYWVNYCSPALKGRAKFISTLRAELLLSRWTFEAKPGKDVSCRTKPRLCCLVMRFVGKVERGRLLLNRIFFRVVLEERVKILRH